MLNLRNRTKRQGLQGRLLAKTAQAFGGKDCPSAAKPDLYSEHKRCFWLVDDLNDALIGPSSKVAVQGEVRRLLAVVARHFRHEEELFARYGYLDGPRHCKRHSEILATCQQLSSKLNQAVHSAVWIECGSLIGRMLEEHLEEERVIYGT